MKFTLSLRDYIDQYITNLENGDNHCPVCYEQVMNDDDKDITHLIDCYKEQLITYVLASYHDKYGDIPEVTDEFMQTLNTRVWQEMERMYKPT